MLMAWLMVVLTLCDMLFSRSLDGFPQCNFMVVFTFSPGAPATKKTVLGSELHLLPVRHVVLRSGVQHLADRTVHAAVGHRDDDRQSDGHGAAVHDVTNGASHAERVPRG